MKRLLTAAAASLLLTLALVAPVGAAGPGCSDFGSATAGLAQEGGFGKNLVSWVAHGGLASIGLDGVGQLVQAEHSGAIFTWPCAKYAP